MVVGALARPINFHLVIELAEIASAALRRFDREASSHAQVPEQCCTIIETGEDVFGAAADCGNAAALQPFHKVLRPGKAQVVPPQRDTADAAAFKGGPQAAHNSFDFWQFRHG